ncbi:hypothetical protein FGB62_129g09 [Gracilaria domingensis]|nr:hypothetical protein FGB62_129g09 [Gracilaria domingensis]
MLHTPIAQQGASWNTFASSAQHFPHAAVSASSHQPPHFSHALPRAQSRPSHSSLPHLRAAQHQQQQHTFIGAHSRAPYASIRNSHMRSEPSSRLEQHRQLGHQSQLKPTQSIHTHQRTSPGRASQGGQTTALAHPGDQATYAFSRHVGNASLIIL